MARPPRLEVPGALYHVTARGNERRAIFRDDRDREEYLSRLASYRDRFGFQLLAYCLMTNHVHLAVRTRSEPLSRIMAGLHSTYAEWFNHRHDRVGHLFQGRYKAFLVQEDHYLHALLRYIHRNPVQARIARRPADYPWSSDRYLRRGRGPAWLDVDPLLALLDRSRQSATRRYVELVDGSSDQPAYDPREAIADVVVGDQSFAVEQLHAAGQPAPALRGVDVDRLLQIVASDCGLTVEDLRGPRCGGEVAAARCRVAYLARHLCRIPVRRVALRLGRDDSSFARPLASLERRLQTDQALRVKMHHLTEVVRRTQAESDNQD